MGIAVVAAVATVVIAAAGVGCIVFLKDLTMTDQTQEQSKKKPALQES